MYVDDALVVSEHGEKLLRSEIGKYFELKEASIGPPKLYLGGRMRKVELENGASAWAFSSSQYVQAAVQNVEVYLATKQGKLPSRANTPISSNYRPEIPTQLTFNHSLESFAGLSSSDELTSTVRYLCYRHS